MERNEGSNEEEVCSQSLLYIETSTKNCRDLCKALNV